MTLLSQHDFESRAGQEKIVKTIHALEAKIHEMEKEIHKLQQKEKMIEKDLQGPEAY
jgi:cell division protein FtsB